MRGVFWEFQRFAVVRLQGKCKVGTARDFLAILFSSLLSLGSLPYYTEVASSLYRGADR